MILPNQAHQVQSPLLQGTEEKHSKAFGYQNPGADSIGFSMGSSFQTLPTYPKFCHRVKHLLWSHGFEYITILE